MIVQDIVRFGGFGSIYDTKREKRQRSEKDLFSSQDAIRKPRKKREEKFPESRALICLHH